MEDRPDIDIIMTLLSVEESVDRDGFTSTEIYETLKARNSGIPAVGKNRLVTLLRQAVEAGKLEAAWVPRITSWGVTVRRQGYRVKAQS